MKYEIWLGNSYTYFERGVVHLGDGTQLELAALLHSGSYGPDSVLIGEKDRLGTFPLRWFLRSGIEFYHVREDTPVVLFHNVGSEDICIDRYGTLQPGECMEVKPGRKHNG